MIKWPLAVTGLPAVGLLILPLSMPWAVWLRALLAVQIPTPGVRSNLQTTWLLVALLGDTLTEFRSLATF